MILARILSPEDIGIYSIGAVLIALTHVFRDFGVTAYIKAEKQITKEHNQTALGILLISAICLSCVLALTAPLWANYFNEPKLTNVILILAIGYIFIPFGSIPYANLIRNLEVNKTSRVAIISTLVYAITCITFALLGFEHLSMAWANLVNILCNGYLYHKESNYQYTTTPRLIHWRKMTQFSIGATSTSLLKTIDKSIPDLMLGKLSTSTNVAYFGKSAATVNLSNTFLSATIHYFALPLLAQLHRNDKDIRPSLLRACSHINILVLPMLIAIGNLGAEIIGVLFGAQWLPSADAIPYLCAIAAIQTFFTLTIPALTAVGRPGVASLPAALELIFKISGILWIYESTLSSFALGLLVGQIACTPIYLYVYYKFLKITPKDLAKTILKVLMVCLACGITSWIAKVEINAVTNNGAIVILTSTVVLALTWIASVAAIKPPIYFEIMQTLKKGKHAYK